MSPEERQLLQGLFDRMRSNANNPRDREAEQMIADNVRQQPYAPYLLAQTVIVQDQALQAANDRLQQLEQQVQDLERNQPQQSAGGGFLSSIFGGGGNPSPRQAPPPQRPGWNQGGYPQGGPPQGYPQGGFAPQQGGPWSGGMPMQQGGGGGFLQGALGAAAGVAGGVLLADSIKGLFGGHNNSLGIASGVPGMGGGETVVNNYYGDGTSADHQQDADQDAAFLNDGGGTSADRQQDADQDQDFAQDADFLDDGNQDA